MRQKSFVCSFCSSRKNEINFSSSAFRRPEEGTFRAENVHAIVPGLHPRYLLCFFFFVLRKIPQFFFADFKFVGIGEALQMTQ